MTWLKSQAEKVFLITALDLLCTVPTNIKDVLPSIFVFVGGIVVLWDVCVCDHQVAVIPFISFSNVLKVKSMKLLEDLPLIGWAQQKGSLVH